MKRAESIESLERRTYLSPLQFSSPAEFRAGSHPSDLVAVDLTGNGIDDVVTTDFTSASIAVLRGDGNGRFTSPVFYPVGNSPEALAAGDLNGDGFPDIVTANEASNSVSVLLNHGDGTFASQVIYGVGGMPEAVAVGDLTGNGLLDIVTANEGSNTISVLLGNGDGTFQPAVNYFVGDQPDGLALGDFNGDSRPDIVTVNPPNNNLHVLLNNGNGTFGHLQTYDTGLAARAVTVADVNSDGRPDIIAANLHSTDVSVLDGSTNGTFADQQNFGTGVFPFSVIVADMNGDGRPDIITANNFDNSVGVLLHNTDGSFSDNKPYRAGGGTGPVAVVAADVNGDGRPDLITADFNTGTISVLLNQTVFVPLIPTSVTLTANQNPVEVKNRLVLSAQITPASPGVKNPVGLVDFFNGDGVIGIGTLSRSGLATISTRKLGLGQQVISAYYNGDGTYHGDLSATLLESVVPATAVSALVEPVITGVRLPTDYVAGEGGVVDLSISNIGDGPAQGVVHVQLYASLSSTFDSTAFPIATVGNPDVNINLAGGFSKLLGLNFTAPANLTAGNYTYFAALAPVSGVNTAQVSGVPAVGITTAQSVLEFGTVGDRRHYVLTRTLGSGSVVSLGLKGAGTGVLTENADGSISVALLNTTPFTNLTIGGGAVTLDELTATDAMADILASNTTLDGDMTLSMGVHHLTLAGATNSNILISGGPPNELSLGTVSGLNLFSAPSINLLSVNSWSNTAMDNITVAYITDLRSAGNFGAHLDLSAGAGGHRISLQSAVIGGALLPSVWSIQDNVASVQVGGVAAGWNGSIHGSIASFLDTGNFAGNLGAGNIGSFKVDGNLTNASIYAGANFGSGGTLGESDDVFGSGILTSFVVDGSVSGSFIAAGYFPPDASLLNRSAIRAVTVLESVDAGTVFTSAVLPIRARINGQTVITADDANFRR